MRMKGRGVRCFAVLGVVLATVLGLAVVAIGDGPTAEIVELHPCSGDDVTDFFELMVTGGSCNLVKIETAVATYNLDSTVTGRVAIGDGMSAYGGVDIVGMDLRCSGVSAAKWIKVTFTDCSQIDFSYGTGSGVVYADKKSGYKGSEWALTPEMAANLYGISDYATPGRETEKPTVVTLTNFKGSSLNKKEEVTFVGIVLVLAVAGVVLFIFDLHSRRLN